MLGIGSQRTGTSGPSPSPRNDHASGTPKPRGDNLPQAGYSKPVDYRPYAPGDFDQLFAIETLCFPPNLRFTRRYLRDLFRRPQTAAWVAEENNQLAGFAAASRAIRQGGITAYVETIEVLPDLRGQGIGSELLRRIETSVAAAGVQTIWLHVDARNAGAIRLYEALQYLCEGGREDFYADGNAALIYKKQLPNESLS